MKKTYLKYLVLVLLSVIVFSCSQVDRGDDDRISTTIVNNPVTASEDNTNTAVPEIKFEEEVYDFGKVIQGEKVTYSFRFTNAGDADLIISGVSASCGCTVPSWPKNIIKPGDDGKINVVFDSDGKKGKQSKTITVVTNSLPSTRVLNIVGEVIVPQSKSGEIN